MDKFKGRIGNQSNEICGQDIDKKGRKYIKKLLGEKRIRRIYMEKKKRDIIIEMSGAKEAVV